MNKILQFVKLHKENKYAGVGMGGNIFMVLNSLLNMNDEDYLYVDMETEDCVCTENNFSKFNTSNCWEYYYDQIEKPEGKIFSLWDDDHILNYKNVELGNKELHKRFNKNFKLKEYLKKDLDNYYEKALKDKITLGVQIRLTDMVESQNVAGLSSYLNKIDEILKIEPKIDQIFLATDDSTVISKVRSHVSIDVLCHEDFYRATPNDPHLTPYDRHNENIRENANYHLSTECIKEIYTLSMCNLLLRAHVSSVSNVAILLSTHINKVYSL